MTIVFYGLNMPLSNLQTLQRVGQTFQAAATAVRQFFGGRQVEAQDPGQPRVARGAASSQPTASAGLGQRRAAVASAPGAGQPSAGSSQQNAQKTISDAQKIRQDVAQRSTGPTASEANQLLNQVAWARAEINRLHMSSPAGRADAGAMAGDRGNATEAIDLRKLPEAQRQLAMSLSAMVAENLRVLNRAAETTQASQVTVTPQDADHGARVSAGYQGAPLARLVPEPPGLQNDQVLAGARQAFDTHIRSLIPPPLLAGAGQAPLGELDAARQTQLLVWRVQDMVRNNPDAALLVGSGAAFGNALNETSEIREQAREHVYREFARTTSLDYLNQQSAATPEDQRNVWIDNFLVEPENSDAIRQVLSKAGLSEATPEVLPRDGENYLDVFLRLKEANSDSAATMASALADAFASSDSEYTAIAFATYKLVNADGVLHDDGVLQTEFGRRLEARMLTERQAFVTTLVNGLGLTGSVRDGLATELMAALAPPSPPILSEALGSGGEATVYEATHRLQDVVVRIPRQQGSEVSDLRALSRMGRVHDDPNVPRLLGVYRNEHGALCTIMERVRGFELTEVNRLGRAGEQSDLPRVPAQTISRSLHVFGGLTRALQTLHQNNIVHADLSAGNIMVSENTAESRLIDFGMAVLSGGRRNIGTIPFAAPEVVRGSMGGTNVAAPSNDIWSLGLHMLGMLGLHDPFENWTAQVETPPEERSNLETQANAYARGRLRFVDESGLTEGQRDQQAGLARRLVGQAMGMLPFSENNPRWQSLPDGVKALIKACLAPDPNDRPTAAQLTQMMDGAEVTAAPGSGSSITNDATQALLRQVLGQESMTAGRIALSNFLTPNRSTTAAAIARLRGEDAFESAEVILRSNAPRNQGQLTQTIEAIRGNPALEGVKEHLIGVARDSLASQQERQPTPS